MLPQVYWEDGGNFAGLLRPNNHTIKSTEGNHGRSHLEGLRAVLTEEGTAQATGPCGWSQQERLKSAHMASTGDSFPAGTGPKSVTGTEIWAWARTRFYWWSPDHQGKTQPETPAGKVHQYPVLREEYHGREKNFVSGRNCFPMGRGLKTVLPHLDKDITC